MEDSRYLILHAKPHALHVDRHHLVPGVGRVFIDGKVCASDAGVVDRNVEPAVVTHRCLDHIGDRGGISHVRAYKGGLEPPGAQFGREFFTERGSSPCNHHTSAFLSEGSCGRLADARGRSGHDGNLTCETTHQVLPHVRFAAASVGRSQTSQARTLWPPCSGERVQPEQTCSRPNSIRNDLS